MSGPTTSIERSELAGGSLDRQRPSRARRWWWRLLHDVASVVAGSILLVIVIVAISAPLLAPQNPLATNAAAIAEPMGSAGYPLGTDEVGRDILSRLIWGARTTLSIGVIAAVFSASLGIVLGTVSGYFGGYVDTIIMRIIDTMMSFPDILLAIVIVTILGPSLENALLAIAILGVPFYVRLVRAEVLRIRSADYLLAAETAGASHRRVIARHVVPNVIPPIIVTASIHVGFLILEAAGLSFLGLGAQPPSPEWGAMVSSGRNYLLIAPHIVLIPAACIFVVVLALNILGDGVRDALDPRGVVGKST